MEKKKGVSKVLKIVLGIVGISVVLCILRPLVFAFFMAVFSSSSNNIYETYRSPQGTYQLDAINSSAGGMDQGVSYLVIEYPDDKNSFSAKNDKKPKKCIEIHETRGHFNSSFDITWISETSFWVVVKYGDTDTVKLAQVEVSGDSYKASEGTVSVIKDKSFLSDFVVNGNDVSINCDLYIQNTMPGKISFTLEAYSSDDKGKLLDTGQLTAADDTGQEKVFEIDGNEKKLIEVSFKGTKGPGNTKVDRNLPGLIKIHVKDYDM